MSADFRELEAFRDKMQELGSGKVSKMCDDCANELAARLLRKVVKRTPVGIPPDSYDIVNGKKVKKDKQEMKEVRKRRRETVKVEGDSGKSRKFLTADAARYQQYWSGYQGGTLRRGWTTGKHRVTGNVHSVDVINPVEYASYVEYGHRQEPGRYVPALGKQLKKSWVPGLLMMTKSEREVKAIAQKIADKRLQELLKKEFNDGNGK